MQIYCKMEVLRDMHLPPGFGFHPSDTELVSHYLKRKILGQKIEYDLIPEVDIYKHEPWDLPGRLNHAFIFFFVPSWITPPPPPPQKKKKKPLKLYL
jgi:hypothetical protein